MYIENCLGHEMLGLCTEYFQFQYSVYNLGAAFSAGAILLALGQFMNPLYKLRLSYRKRFFIIALLLGSLNIISVFVAAIAPYFLLLSGIPMISYSIFWEILAGIFFVSSIVVLLCISLMKVKDIDSESALKRMVKLSIIYIAKGEGYHVALAQELPNFIESVFKNFIRIEKTKFSHELSLLQILADRSFCKLITVSEPRTLEAIVHEYKKSINYNVPSFLIREIMNQSLSCNNSLIARELTGEGIGMLNNRRGILVSSILEEYGLVGKYRIFRDSWSFEDQINDVYIHNFIKLWEKLVSSFFETKDNLKYAESLLDIFELIDVFFSKTKDIRLIPGAVSWTIKFNHELVDKTEDILSFYKDIPSIPKKDYGDGQLAYDQFAENNLFGVLAKGIYKMLESTKEIDESWERNFYLDIYSILDNTIDSSVINAIRERLEIMFEAQIKENLNGWYPMILRVFFHIHGYQIFTFPEKITKFELKMLKLLADRMPDFDKGYIRNTTKDSEEKVIAFHNQKAKEILLDMLPSGISYDASKNVLKYIYNSEIYGKEIYLDELKNTGMIVVKDII